MVLHLQANLTQTSNFVVYATGTQPRRGVESGTLVDYNVTTKGGIDCDY